MKLLHGFGVALILGALVLAGCQQQSSPPKGTPKQEDSQSGKVDPMGQKHGGPASEAEIKAALAKLSPEDRELAEAQQKCPVTGELLGSMGTPDKVTVKGETVFLCCDGCRTKAQAHADRTLAKVKEFKAEKADTPEK